MEDLMEISELSHELHKHEGSSQARYEDLKHHIEKGTKMSDAPHIKNIFEPGVGMGMNPMAYGFGGTGAGGLAGAGAGILGGILGGALLGGNGGLFGRRGEGEACVTPSQLTAALAGVQDTQMNTAVLQELGKISGAIPAAEGQVQLALAQSQNALSNQIGQQSISIVQGFANTNQNVSQAQAAIIAVGETVKDAVNTTSAATQLGIANLATAGLQNTYAITQAIRDDGDKTRALLISQNETTLTRQLAVAEAALLESRAEGRTRGTEVNVSQVVNQAQAQAQQQQQQQQQILLLNQLCAHFATLQNAVATNSNLIVGNTGATTTGAQTANPVNVRA
jgi:hypothetical protein